MILNVSGRTDILAFYSKWFLNRYQNGFVDVRNPFNPKLVSRIFFEDVDAIVFCTKNPIPFLTIQRYITHPYVVQVTITGYKEDIEPNVPSKKDVIEAVKIISERIGRENVMVRYDPIFISEKYSLSYHKKAFQKLCQELQGCVKQIIVSFVDIYRNVLKNSSVLSMKKIMDDDMEELAKSFVQSASRYDISVQTCSENNRLLSCGFVKRDCVDEVLASRLTGKIKFKPWKARNNSACHCVEMVDIGVYNSCKHLCKYCYANYDESKISSHVLSHDENSSLLVGHLSEDDIIKRRKT